MKKAFEALTPEEPPGQAPPKANQQKEHWQGKDEQRRIHGVNQVTHLQA